MPKEVIKTDKGPSPLGAYSQGWRAGDFVFITGTAPVDGDGKVAGDSVADQTRVVIENLRGILEAAGAGLDDVVKSMVYLWDTDDFAEFNEVYAKYFQDPRPVRTTIGVDMRQVPGMKIEIDVIAYVGD
ncbi:MAG TPA: Rid family detoxifying hydrolase [Solirubrobacterales bacterium]|nr:Rid family detoxifying hydrolase [Solirubrobacterales bacterium]